MTPRGKKYLLKPLVLLTAAVALQGCISPTPDSSGRYTVPIGGSPVIANETPYSDSLRCLGSVTATRPIRVAVGQIADYTGKTENDAGGRKLTQGSALMAMSALSKAGVNLVERFDTSVAEMELKYANNKLITDEPGASGQPGRLPQDHGGLDPGLRLLPRRRHHRAQLQHPLDGRQCRWRHDATTASRAPPGSTPM
jgi:curli biogenesis system outer membrane secretion channel CsgG